MGNCCTLFCCERCAYTCRALTLRKRHIEQQAIGKRYDLYADKVEKKYGITVRPIYKDGFVKLDGSTRRLNVSVDDDGIITGICGWND